MAASKLRHGVAREQVKASVPAEVTNVRCAVVAKAFGTRSDATAAAASAFRMVFSFVLTARPASASQKPAESTHAFTQAILARGEAPPHETVALRSEGAS